MQAIGLLFLFFALGVACRAQDNDGLPPFVEVYWKSARSLPVYGAKNLVVLDPEIAQVSATDDHLEFVGVERGETVILATIDGKQVSTRVRVIARPETPVPPSVLLRQMELGHGMFSTDFQVSNNIGGGSHLSATNSFNWAQPLGENRRFDFSSIFESNTVVQNETFNIRRAAITYYGHKVDFHVFDFNVNVIGSTQNYMSQYAFPDAIDLRGASLTLRGEKNTYTVYGGTTIPFSYLELGATRDVAGFNFQRQQSANLLFYANSTFVNAPQDVTGVLAGRLNSFMQTAGFTYRPSTKWLARSTGGFSNHGGLGEGEVDYTTSRLTAFVAGVSSAPMFPVNQLQSLLSGTSLVRTGVMVTTSRRFGESLFYEHAVTTPVANILRSGSSDFASPGLWVHVAKGQDANFTYTYSRQSGGFGTSNQTGNREDISWHSQFARGISNSAQVDIGSLQDPLGLNSQDQYSFNDSFVMPIRRGNLMFGFQQSRTNPSLVSRINSELGLLSPALQQLFLKDPVSFVEEGDLPPDIRALVEASQPISTGFSVGGQFRPTEKLTVSPMFSYIRSTNGTTQSWSPFFGYGLAYQLNPTLQLRSSMTNVWVLTGRNALPQRTTVFSVGLTKTFSAVPPSFNPLRHGRSIDGQVFRDNNINGVQNPGEPGLGGVAVRLDGGQTVITDKNGRYHFSGVSAGIHDVSIDLDQFQGPVRMTTSNQYQVDLIREHQAEASFGIINFARVMGGVYNDLRFQNFRQPDAKGMPEIRMTLENEGWQRTFVSSGTGDYELDDVPPGQYTLTVDANSLPANYKIAVRSFPINVTPVSTVLEDIPIRALRSIAGKVFLQVASDTPGGKPQLVPMADVKITAGYGIATTDSSGEFLLRDLPAGDLTVTLVPEETPPTEIKIPTGQVRMPPEPIQVQGATIVISNPELVKYLVGKTASQVKSEAAGAPGAAQ